MRNSRPPSPIPGFIQCPVSKRAIRISEITTFYPARPGGVYIDIGSANPREYHFQIGMEDVIYAMQDEQARLLLK